MEIAKVRAFLFFTDPHVDEERLLDFFDVGA